MAGDRINQFNKSVNHQIEFYETINEYISKASALAQITLHDDFLEYPDKIIHHYLWALNEILEKAYVLSNGHCI